MRKPDYDFLGYFAEDLEIEVSYDYAPAEAMTRTYPGSEEEIIVRSVKWNGTELMDAIEKDKSHIRPEGERDLASHLEIIEDQCWEHIERSNPEDDGKGDYLHDLRKEEGL